MECPYVSNGREIAIMHQQNMKKSSKNVENQWNVFYTLLLLLKQNMWMCFKMLRPIENN